MRDPYFADLQFLSIKHNAFARNKYIFKKYVKKLFPSNNCIRITGSYNLMFKPHIKINKRKDKNQKRDSNPANSIMLMLFTPLRARAICGSPKYSCSSIYAWSRIFVQISHPLQLLTRPRINR